MKILNIKRNLIALLLLQCVITVAAQIKHSDNGISYKLNLVEKTATVVADTDSKYSGKVVIPETLEYEGMIYNVTAIGEKAFSLCSGLTEITIPNSVAAIGQSAFYYCAGLTNITIPNSVTTIDAYAFDLCYRITSINIPSSVTIIGDNAFRECSELTAVHISDLSAWCKINFGEDANPLHYAHNLYLNGTLLTDLVIPGDVTQINPKLFNGCTGIINVTIPNSVTTIGDNAFGGCTGLTSVIIPGSVTAIGDNAFGGCSSITEIYCFATSVPTAHSDAFKDCNIENATLYVPEPSSDDYKNDALWGTFGTIKLIADINGVTYELDIMKKKATVTISAGNEYSGKITIPETVEWGGVAYNVTAIGKDAFRNCITLVNVTIPGSVTAIGNNAFVNTALWDLHPDGVIYINDWIIGYKGDKSASDIIIKEGTRGIADNAFQGFENLTDVYCYATQVPHIQVNSFDSYAATLYVPEDYVDNYINSKVWGFFGEVKVIAEGILTDEGLAYIFNVVEKTATVYGAPIVIDADISDTIEYGGVKYIVTTIGEEAFANCEFLHHVTIPNTITTIGQGAFVGCTRLHEITIPNSVTTIGAWAFAGCIRLYEKITIPNSVTRIGVSAFEATPVDANGWLLDYQSYFGEVVIAEGTKGVAGGAYCFCDITSVTIPGSVLTIGVEAFKECTDLTNVTLLDGIKRIEAGAFSYCTGLTNITIPSSVTTIEADAFSGCTGLTSVTIPDGVTTIESGIFSGCTGLTSVTIPDGVTTIGTYAFSGCSELTNISIPSSVTTIETGAFSGCTGLTSITIPDGVKVIKSNTFENCSGLTSVTIPEGVILLDAYAFNRCIGLKSVTILNDKTIVDPYAFAGCIGLIGLESPTINGVTYAFDILKKEATVIECEYGKYTGDIVIPEKLELENGVYDVVAIEAGAFSGCTDLTSVTIPNSVTTIGENAFEFCSGLTNVTIPGSVTIIRDLTFFECSGLTSVTISDGVERIWHGAFAGCTGLTNITIPNSVTDIVSSVFADCTGLTSITIPNSVTRIGQATFSGCTGLTSITIPNSVTIIETVAFRDCTGLTSITIPGNVEYIEAGAFRNCTNLTNVIFEDYVVIYGDAFYDCSNLESIYSVSATPPHFNFSELYAFTEEQYNNAVLYVPEGALETYRTANVWMNFKNIKEFNTTDIDDVENDDAFNGLPDTYYDMRGRIVENPAPGIYIYNGKKVLVK